MYLIKLYKHYIFNKIKEKEKREKERNKQTKKQWNKERKQQRKKETEKVEGGKWNGSGEVSKSVKKQGEGMG